jgi:(1->4)-alpha-D-glucan 1-alpha-D-glucosylmutase
MSQSPATTAGAAHRPGPGRAVPTATYRFQVQPAFTFDQAADQTDYLAALGVSHAYVSPVLQPEPGSTHGYDVVDHSRFNEEAGGGTGFEGLGRALADQGLGLIVDLVPNHVATPTPAWLNQPWWSLLRDGRESPYAAWFDVDWAAEDDRVLVPVLGASLDEVVAKSEVTVARDGGPDGDEWVVRYYDHAFPVRAGTEDLELPELLAAQHYRLVDWREGGTRLNYRRFFDVTTLAAVRVEDPDVFDATHRLLLDAFDSGVIDGFRIDHPDGLADPTGYLARLADATDDAWVVAEKILEGHEDLPDYWRCAGTTGYDALLRVQQVFHDSAGSAALTSTAAQFLGEEQDLDDLVVAAKRQVVSEVQAAEVNRLMRLVARVLPHHDPGALRRALETLLVAFDRYRAYLGGSVPPGRGDGTILDAAEARAMHDSDPGDREAVQVVAELARGGRLPQAQADSATAQQEFVRRFQQTTGPVMAKGIEDTAFYRYVRLTGLNEVGGDPGRIGLSVNDFHEYAAQRHRTWPLTMTTLSTHDTKRSEDVRARLAVLSELPDEWARWVATAHELSEAHRSPRLDPATEYFLWQTVVGAWPITAERLKAYATKAIREAKLHTTWSEPDAAYEEAVLTFVDALVTDPAIGRHVEDWLARTAQATRANILGQKLVQLTMPGVPDVYQGTELVDLSLVDPDNRRLVDYGERSKRLARLDGGQTPRDLDDEKLRVTSAALRLRRDRPGWFVGEDSTYAPVATTSDRALAFARGNADGPKVVTVATRLAAGLEADGGWGDATVALPPGEWEDVLTGHRVRVDGSGGATLERLLGELPVALLVAHGSLGGDEHS